MLKIEKTEVYGWEAALRGMRNPKNSWGRSDTVMKSTVLKAEEIASGVTVYNQEYCAPYPVIGPNDLKLATQLRNAGPEHAKFLRMIAVTCDITGPLYWWKEFDTYKVGTVANSCSTMHKIMEKPFEIDDFSHEHLLGFIEACNLMNELHPMEILDNESLNLDVGVYQNKANIWSPSFILIKTIDALNQYRNLYIRVKNAATIDEKKKSEILKKIWWQVIQLLPSSYNQKRTVFLNYWVLANIYHQRQHHKQDEWRVTFCDWIKSLPYSNLITGDETK